MTDFLPHLMRS